MQLLFGLDPLQISFFVQGTLPLLDVEGRPFLKTPWQINTGADGNGQSLLALAESGILDRWKQRGVEYIHTLAVDNPLADPFDAELLGFHQEQGVEMTLKCTLKKERRHDGVLKRSCSNLSLFCFSLSFIKDLASTKKILPLHKAWKAAQYVDCEGKIRLSAHPIAWKFETFIFDWIMYARKTAALVYPREQCFAPLKNFKGCDSPETVREALFQEDRRVIQALTGVNPPDFPFELAADFYYPTKALQAKWAGKTVTTSKELSFLQPFTQGSQPAIIIVVDMQK
jgi:UDP-N-acetylglucosamine/UDP-N-acetylgalactosamine diphosphorylase